MAGAFHDGESDLRSWSFGRGIFDEFEALHEAHATHVANDGMLLLEFFEFGAEVSAGVGGVGFEIFFFDEINHGFGSGVSDGIAAESGDVNAFPSVGDFGFCDSDANGHAVTEAFGAGHDIRRDTPLFDTEPLIAGAAPACLDFIADEDAAVFADDFGDDLEIFFGRRDEAADALDGLGDHSGDAARSGGADEIFDILRTLDVAGRISEAEGATVAIGVVREDDAWLRLGADFPRRMTGDCESHGGAAVIGVAESDDVTRTGVAAGEHNGGFVGFGAAVTKERLLQVAWSDGGDFLGEGDLGFGEEDGGDVLEFIELGMDFGVDFRVAMANADGENAAEEIEILVAVGIPDELVFGAFDDERLFEIVKDRGEEEFFLREDDFLFSHC